MEADQGFFFFLFYFPPRYAYELKIEIYKYWNEIVPDKVGFLFRQKIFLHVYFSYFCARNMFMLILSISQEQVLSF